MMQSMSGEKRNADVSNRGSGPIILRRIIQHLKDRDWPAITIELVIVTLGVLLGIQFSNWNDERRERAMEKAYLERVLDDIDLSIETTENVRRFLTGYSDNYALILRATRSCELPTEDRDAFADGMSDLGKIGPSVFVLGTMDEMLSSGSFGLIRNRDIRDLLNGLKRDSVYQAEVRSALYAYIEEMANFAGRYAVREYAERKGPFDPVGWEEMNIDFPALCNNRPFRASVSHVRAMTDNMIDLNDRALTKLRPAREALKQELDSLR